MMINCQYKPFGVNGGWPIGLLMVTSTPFGRVGMVNDNKAWRLQLSASMLCKGSIHPIHIETSQSDFDAYLL
jgi:hypothetical protein